jgi:hypothetical protein
MIGPLRVHFIDSNGARYPFEIDVMVDTERGECHNCEMLRRNGGTPFHNSRVGMYSNEVGIADAETGKILWHKDPAVMALNELLEGT